MEPFEIFYDKFVNGELSPLNRRRKILIESQYVYPSSGDKAIMDIYALYALWWEIGSGKSTYGYEEQDIRNHKVREKVNRYFEEALVVICNTLLEESKFAVADEAEHIYDHSLFSPYEDKDGVVMNPMKDIVQWFKQNNLLHKLQKAYNGGDITHWFDIFDYNETIQMFSAPFWRHANLYGGKKWAKITEAAKQLDNAIRRENVQNLMGVFDKFMDLEHNTGSLYSKLDKLKVSKETLDLRAGFKTPQDFLPYVSDQVKKLIGLMRY